MQKTLTTHVQRFLPAKKFSVHYFSKVSTTKDITLRTHTKSLINKPSDLNGRHFLIRALYKDCY